MSKKTEKSEIQMELDDLAILLTVLSEKIHNLSYYEYLQTEQNDGLRQRLHKIIQIHSNYVTLEHSMFLVKNYPNLQPYFPDAVLALTHPNQTEPLTEEEIKTAKSIGLKMD